MNNDSPATTANPALDLVQAPSCGCDHESQEAAGDARWVAADGTAVLDARAIPHAIRHQTVFDALAQKAAGESLILIAPHDPLPLLRQIEQRDPATFDVAYEESGPTAWRLRITRRSA